MTFAQKLRASLSEDSARPLTVAFLGDSVTAGCFGYSLKDEAHTKGWPNPDASYPEIFVNLAQHMFAPLKLWPVYAGVGGDNAQAALLRVERDVLSHTPDLTVVCLGLNNAGAGEEGLLPFLGSMREIFTRLRETGSEVWYMSPNSFNTSLDLPNTAPEHHEVARHTERCQNDGSFDMYVAAIRGLCSQLGVTYCPCYEKWKAITAGGGDVTMLLDNRINHPDKTMHALFAWSLIDTLLGTIRDVG